MPWGDIIAIGVSFAFCIITLIMPWFVWITRTLMNMQKDVQVIKEVLQNADKFGIGNAELKTAILEMALASRETAADMATAVKDMARSVNQLCTRVEHLYEMGTGNKMEPHVDAVPEV